LVTAATIASCTKDPSQNSAVIERINTNRAIIKEKIKLHSAGLKYFYNALNNENLKTKSFSPQTPVPTIPPVTMQEVKSNVISFLDQNNIAQTKELAVLSSEFVDSNVQIVPLSDLNFKFTTNFYKLGLDIINVAGNNLVEVNSNINIILNSNDFINLSEIEQNILISSAETYLDSFAYWSENDPSWGVLAASYHRNDVIITKGPGKGGRYYAREDAKGAIAGGIGGALGGALVGTAAGGVGAGPGALLGFVGGAISGGVGNSILAFLNSSMMIAEPVLIDEEATVTLYDLAVPEIWTKAAFNTDTPIPTSINFESGLINVTN